MSDNIYYTQLGNQIKELPSQEEIGEKPYDDESAPTPLFPVNDNQNQLEKPDDDIQIQYEDPPYIMTNNAELKINYKDQDNYSSCTDSC